MVTISETTESWAEPASIAAPASMQKWLTLGESRVSWQLPDDTSLDLLEALIKAAMRSGDPLTVEVEGAQRGHRVSLVLNGRAMPFVVLSERPELRIE